MGQQTAKCNVVRASYKERCAQLEWGVDSLLKNVATTECYRWRLLMRHQARIVGLESLGCLLLPDEVVLEGNKQVADRFGTEAPRRCSEDLRNSREAEIRVARRVIGEADMGRDTG